MKRFLTAMLALILMLGCCALGESYTTKLEEGVEIYYGPGYDYGYVRDVEADGVYTIVEEEICEDGYLWGKLKSGAGWAMLRRTVFATDYTVKLGGWVPIYDGYGYDSSYVCTVGEDGVYTIVQEAVDTEGIVWGKLKSGIGWVDLDYVRTMGDPVITANYADDKLLREGGYTLYNDGDPEYLTQIAFHAHEDLSDVHLYRLEYSGEDYVAAEELHSFGLFFEDTPFVAGLNFWGDMTTYGISFTDNAGMERAFMVYISGRNGSLVMQEYIP